MVSQNLGARFVFWCYTADVEMYCNVMDLLPYWMWNVLLQDAFMAMNARCRFMLDCMMMIYQGCKVMLGCDICHGHECGMVMNPIL